ncbi:MAG: VWA domain-containing protein [Burkholderiaceae bacterium]|nr:VWA domain-containing protein [Burkholderiaceae bacterium]
MNAAAPSTATLDDRLLADRVRQCVPLRHPAFGKLLQLLSIEATDAVPTAAVTVGARSRLLINPAFVAERCRTDAHLSMLVMHELYHVLLGHTRMVRRPTLAANWAFDCIVNAQLCRLHPDVEFTSFFSAGAAPEGLWSLIAPPPGWPASPRYASGALGDVHRRLYDDAGATTAELFALLERVVVVLDADGARRLLGSHGEEPQDGDPLHADPELLAEVRRIVARWPMVDRRGGTDDGGATTWERSELRRHRAARRAVRELLRAAAFGTDGGPWVRHSVETEAFTPLPHAGDRRAQLQRAMGAQPLWWQGVLHRDGREPAGQVAVYLDVSGSMAAWLPVLLEALTDSAALVQWPLFGFSTEVHPVTRAELAAGRFRSTGGTHIACVARHLVESRASRAVVITDGDVQEIPSALAERLRRARPRVRVGLLDGCDGSFCARLGWPVARIPALDKASA